jgi:hypothetical protein
MRLVRSAADGRTAQILHTPGNMAIATALRTAHSTHACGKESSPGSSGAEQNMQRRMMADHDQSPLGSHRMMTGYDKSPLSSHRKMAGHDQSPLFPQDDGWSRPVAPVPTG